MSCQCQTTPPNIETLLLLYESAANLGRGLCAKLILAASQGEPMTRSQWDLAHQQLEPAEEILADEELRAMILPSLNSDCAHGDVARRVFNALGIIAYATTLLKTCLATYPNIIDDTKKP